MKKYGSRCRSVRFPGKVDCHPKKGYVNWWECDMVPVKSRSSMRLDWLKEIYMAIFE